MSLNIMPLRCVSRCEGVGLTLLELTLILRRHASHLPGTCSTDPPTKAINIKWPIAALQNIFMELWKSHINWDETRQGFNINSEPQLIHTPNFCCPLSSRDCEMYPLCIVCASFFDKFTTKNGLIKSASALCIESGTHTYTHAQKSGLRACVWVRVCTWHTAGRQVLLWVWGAAILSVFTEGL